MRRGIAAGGLVLAALCGCSGGGGGSGGEGSGGGASGEGAVATPEVPSSEVLGEVALVVGGGAAEVCGASCERASAGSAVRVGAGVVTDSGARAQVRLGEGVSLWLDAGTRVRVLEAGAVQVESGRVLVESSGALRVESPAGTLVLEGGSASVRAEEASGGAARTRISVLTGRGQLRSGGDAKALAAGEAALAEGSGEVRVLPSADLAYQTSWAREMRVEAEAGDEAGAPRGIGDILGRDPATKREIADAIVIKELSVHATVRDRVARTEIEQVFVNQTRQTLEGVYTFPLPPDASIVRFAMEVNGQLMEGEILEKERAVRIFDRVVADYMRPKDPALLEWKGGNTFQMRIFPMFAGKASRVVLWYTQTLASDGAEARYTYPLPRTGQQEIASFRFSADVATAEPLRSVRTPMYASSVDMPQGGTQAQVRFEKAGFHPRQDLVLEWESSRYAASESWVGRGPGGEEARYFMMALRPSLVEAAGEATPAGGQDYVFLVDTSYGMGEGDLKAAVAAVAAFLAELQPDDRFTVVAGGQRFGWYARGMQPWTMREVQQALGFLEQQRPEGASWLEGLFAEGSQALSGDRPSALIYVGDGRATLGETRPEALADAIERRFTGPHRPVVHAIGLGSSVELPLLGILTRRTGGSARVVNRGEDVPKRVRGMAASARRPALRQALLAFSSPQIERVYPSQLPTLRQGEELVIVGRFRGEVDAQVTLTGLLGDKPFAQPFRVRLSEAQATGQSFVPRLWAQRHIEHLAVYGDASARDEIVATSLKHTVLSPHTAFLVLESERMYRDFQVNRNKDRDYWAPDAPKAKEQASAPGFQGQKGEEVAEEESAAAAQAEDADDNAPPADTADALLPVPTEPLAASEPPAPLGGGGLADEDMEQERASQDPPPLDATLSADKSQADLGGLEYKAARGKGSSGPAPSSRPKPEPAKVVANKGGGQLFDDLGPLPSTRAGEGRRARYVPRPFASIQSLAPEPGAPGAAFAELERQIQAEPLRRELRRRLIKAHLERGDGASALAAAEAWRAQDPQSAEVSWRLGDLLARQGRWEEAMLRFGESVELNPRDQGALRRWAQALALHERFPLAAAAHSALLALSGKADDALDRILVEVRADRQAAREHLAQLRAMQERELSAAQRSRADDLSRLLDQPGGVTGGFADTLPEGGLRGAASAVLRWDAPVDLELSVLLPNGERISPAMPRSVRGDGKRGRVVAEHSGGPGAQEGILLEWAPPGRYIIEVTRHDAGASSAPVEAQIALRALGQQRTFRVQLPPGDVDARVAQVVVELR